MHVKGWMLLRHACPLLETTVNKEQDGTVREMLFRQEESVPLTIGWLQMGTQLGRTAVRQLVGLRRGK